MKKSESRGGGGGFGAALVGALAESAIDAALSQASGSIAEINQMLDIILEGRYQQIGSYGTQPPIPYGRPFPVGPGANVVARHFEKKNMSEQSKKVEVKEEAKKDAPEKVIQITGKVAAIDKSEMTVTIKGKKDEITVAIPDAGMIKGITVSDNVTCKYVEKEGVLVCKSIEKQAKIKKQKKAEK